MKITQDKVFSTIALIYMVQTYLAIPLHGKALMCDCLIPLMMWQCWRKRRELLAYLREKYILVLILALGWMTLSTLVHCIQGNYAFFDLGVFLYMGLIFAFYLVTPLPSSKKWVVVSSAVLGLTLAGYLATKCMDVRGTCLEGLLYYDRHFAQLEPNVLVTRYQFLSKNPNLLGGAYILPTLLLLPTLKEALEKRSWSTFGTTVILTILGILPLLGTASKTAIMTFGILAGAYACAPLLKPIHPKIMATILVTAFGVLCLITVLFKTYPAYRTAPWVDFSKRGNYSVHQEIYAKIILKGGLRGMLFGYAPGELHELYPKYADEAHVREILEPYGFGQDTPLYCTFMDPHNEYLNTASFFGIPALLAMVIFLGMMFWRTAKTGYLSITLMILGVFFCLFWDDMASKRSLWAALGVLASKLIPTNGLPEMMSNRGDAGDYI